MQARRLCRIYRQFRKMSSLPRVTSSNELPASEAKWITLKKLTYLDVNGKERLWECAERKTRRSANIDAVSILAILRSKTKAFNDSTVVIEQYRPPIDKYVVELPAGLIDEGETPERAAFRELEEETGYQADSVIDSSPVIVCDPGMTNANMKFFVLNVLLNDQMEWPKQKLETGEFIKTSVVELSKLKSVLDKYDRDGFVIDARLSHFAAGYSLMKNIS